eukprot:CAMPEP_0202721864 /NCGR_PEP_ID=MMETSP1385-20130828/152321_1 /ASSEMBLY_ACC=CAM_ASM_000861 /TAXON_ID=933848 /ORGANISM="Elphidium margaritaceum" /LENGTH=43 /DNA_ID= /DNA_START= /DNA_END= /DNA_ORIENTATION=
MDSSTVAQNQSGILARIDDRQRDVFGVLRVVFCQIFARVSRVW